MFEKNHKNRPITLTENANKKEPCSRQVKGMIPIHLMS